MDDQQTTQQPNNPRGQTYPKWVQRCISEFKRHRQERRTTRAHESAADRAARSTARSTKFIAVLTLVLAGAAILQYKTFEGQLGVLQGQLDEMSVEQRPWVYSDPPTINEKITLNDGVYKFWTTFHLHNIGHIPAQFVNVISMTTVVNDGGDVVFHLRDTCGKSLVPSAIGSTVFPNQPFTQDSVNVVKQSDLKATIATGLAPFFVIFGCVVYQFPKSLQQHVSKFVYSMQWRSVDGSPKGQMGLIYDPVGIPLNEIRMHPWGAPGAFDAD